MGNRLRRLLPAVDVARRGEETAAAELGRLRNQLAQHKARLGQLISFRTEYSRKLEVDGQRGLSVRSVQNVAGFVSNLDERIGQAGKESASLNEQIDDQSRTWAAARARHQALLELLRRCRAEEGRIQDKREQAASDEWSIRRYAMVKARSG